MSSHTSKLKTAAAVLVAAFMLVTPLAVTFDSDAEIAEAEAGYSSEGTNEATDAQLLAAGLATRNAAITGNLFTLLTVFNLLPVTAVTDAESFTVYSAEGEQYGDSFARKLSTTGSDVKNITATFTFTADCKLVVVDPSDIESSEGLKEAADAIKAYLGEDVKTGDKLVVKGDASMYYATERRTDFAYIDDTSAVATKDTETSYNVMSSDFTIELIKSGETEGKSIKMNASISGSDVETTTYTYAKEIKDLKPGDECSYVTHYDADISSDEMTFKVDGKNYDVKPKDTPHEDEKGNEPVDIKTVSNIKVSDSLQNKVDTYTGSDHATVKKSFDDAQSSYDDIQKKVDGEKKSKLPLIIGGVAAAVVIIGIVAFFVVRKRA